MKQYAFYRASVIYMRSTWLPNGEMMNSASHLTIRNEIVVLKRTVLKELTEAIVRSRSKPLSKNEVRNPGHVNVVRKMKSEILVT